MEQYKQEFIEFMVDSEVLKFGEFTLKSGRKAPYFINTGNYKTGEQIAKLGEFYAKCIEENNVSANVFFGPAYKGIPLCVAAASSLFSQFGKNVNYCFNRKEAKDHGEGGVIVGHKLSDGDNVLIIEDVITAGTAIRETLPILKAAADVNISGVIISVDRMEKGKGEKSAVQEVFDEFGIKVYPIVTVEDIIECIKDGTIEGKEYLDFAAGFAVSGLGYDNKELNQALKDQIDKLYHTSNLYYHESCGEAAQELNRISGMDRVFFTNSGGEANEGALKAARRYAYTKKTGRYEFIAMQNSFHGRSFGAVSVTGHDSYREPFEPVVPGVRFAEFNDLDSVKALVNDKTCAIILEPLQGEGGINLATQEFMEGIRKICDENGILMICDEVQCGMGRTGNMFAWQGFGVKPDILTMAKAIGNGIPVGAFAMTEEVAKYSLQPGDHGATYEIHWHVQLLRQ